MMKALKFYDEVIKIVDGIVHVSSREWLINFVINKDEIWWFNLKYTVIWALRDLDVVGSQLSEKICGRVNDRFDAANAKYVNNFSIMILIKMKFWNSFFYETLLKANKVPLNGAIQALRTIQWIKWLNNWMCENFHVVHKFYKFGAKIQLYSGNSVRHKILTFNTK